MKKYFNNFKWGVLFGLWFFVTISASVFAYQFTNYADVWDVSSWQILSKDTFNQLLADVRYLKNNQGWASTWPAFRARITTGQTFGITDKIIDWERLDFDTNNNFDLVNNRFLPTKAGKYNVACNFWWSNMWDASTWHFINIYKNWVIYSKKYVRYAWTTISSSTSTTVDMNWISDYVDCRISDGSDSSWVLSPTYADYTWFEWYYIWS